MTRALLLVLAGCSAAMVPSSPPASDDTGLDGLALSSVEPGLLIPGSTLLVRGDSFVDASYGQAALRLRGTLGGAAVDLAVPLAFDDYQHLHAAWPGGRAAGLPADGGGFSGSVAVEFDSTVDGQTHASNALQVTLQLAPALAPRLDAVAGGVIYVNQPVGVEGDGLLLGGGEGQTVAEVSGCFQLEGGASCDPVGPIDVPVTAASPADRQHGSFAFAPAIAGIRPGHFDGAVVLANGAVRSESQPVAFDVIPPAISDLTPPAASLGQYVAIDGGGFVGPERADDTTSYTVIALSGSFSYDDDPTVYPVDLELVPEVVSGLRLRYVVNEQDALGRTIDLRTRGGSFSGTVQPIVHYRGDTISGDPVPVTLGIAHITQVVWLRFLPAYTESLRHFGLRAADELVRQRVLAVARRDYAGVNVDFRTEEPTDFALYTTVDIGGPDLNGLGLFGYDNTPGKDVGNQRLYDQVGGLNAVTQEDGSAGYGGVFVESFFGFSEHPDGLAMQVPDPAPEFDQIFDPFRPDAGGRPVRAADLAGVSAPTSGAVCPTAAGRSAELACAVWVLGSMVGSTVTHEFGHSLGLAAGGGQDHVHNSGDRPNRLMDAGGDRPFLERAEIEGQGPAVFCDGDYANLRQILPAADPPPDVDRPPCN